MFLSTVLSNMIYSTGTVPGEHLMLFQRLWELEVHGSGSLSPSVRLSVKRERSATSWRNHPPPGTQERVARKCLSGKSQHKQQCWLLYRLNT
jgi:hypothetical protein